MKARKFNKMLRKLNQGGEKLRRGNGAGKDLPATRPFWMPDFGSEARRLAEYLTRKLGRTEFSVRVKRGLSPLVLPAHRSLVASFVHGHNKGAGLDSGSPSRPVAGNEMSRAGMGISEVVSTPAQHDEDRHDRE